MDDHRHTYTELLAFLDTHGRCVDPHFPRTGLDHQDARAFLALLHRFQVRPLGIERWRYTPDGFDVDGPKGWYADNVRLEDDHLSALAYLESEGWDPRDLFVMQY